MAPKTVHGTQSMALKIIHGTQDSMWHPGQSVAPRTIRGTQDHPWHPGQSMTPKTWHPRHGTQDWLCLVVVSAGETSAALAIYIAVLCQLAGLP